MSEKNLVYNGQKYDGALIHPIDSNVENNIKQENEFASIVLKTLISQGRLVHSDKITYGMSTFNNSVTSVKIASKNEELHFLCKFTPINFFSLEDVCRFNDKAQKMFKEGGLYGLKETGLIDNLLYIIKYSEIFGENKFPTVIDKATQIWYKIARYQSFNNGNKRTALLTASAFLSSNQLFFNMDSKEMNLQLYDISKKIASGKYNERDVKEFIFNNVKVDFEIMEKMFHSKKQFNK